SAGSKADRGFKLPVVRAAGSSQSKCRILAGHPKQWVQHEKITRLALNVTQPERYTLRQLPVDFEIPGEVAGTGPQIADGSDGARAGRSIQVGVLEDDRCAYHCTRLVKEAGYSHRVLTEARGQQGDTVAKEARSGANNRLAVLARRIGEAGTRCQGRR